MNLLQMSLSGAVLIVAIIVIRALFLHKLPKKTFTILWTLVLIRLLLPFSIPSSFSIYSWFPSINSARESYIADNNTSERVKKYRYVLAHSGQRCYNSRQLLNF